MISDMESDFTNGRLVSAPEKNEQDGLGLDFE